MIYKKVESTYKYDVKSLFCVQDAELDKFFQELSTPSAIANVAQAITNHKFVRNCGTYVFSQHSYGIACSSHIRGRRRQAYNKINRSICQICNKNGHLVIDY